MGIKRRFLTYIIFYSCIYFVGVSFSLYKLDFINYLTTKGDWRSRQAAELKDIWHVKDKNIIGCYLNNGEFCLYDHQRIVLNESLDTEYAIFLICRITNGGLLKIHFLGKEGEGYVLLISNSGNFKSGIYSIEKNSFNMIKPLSIALFNRPNNELEVKIYVQKDGCLFSINNEPPRRINLQSNKTGNIIWIESGAADVFLENFILEFKGNDGRPKIIKDDFRNFILESPLLLELDDKRQIIFGIILLFIVVLLADSFPLCCLRNELHRLSILWANIIPIILCQYFIVKRVLFIPHLSLYLSHIFLIASRIFFTAHQALSFGVRDNIYNGADLLKVKTSLNFKKLCLLFFLMPIISLVTVIDMNDLYRGYNLNLTIWLLLLMVLLLSLLFLIFNHLIKKTPYLKTRSGAILLFFCQLVWLPCIIVLKIINFNLNVYFVYFLSLFLISVFCFIISVAVSERIKYSSILTFLIFILTFFFMEFGVRATFLNDVWDYKNKTKNIFWNVRNHTDYFGNFSKEKQIRIHNHTNRTIKVKKSKGAFRIICLGTSTVEGFTRGGYVKTYAELLEQRLNSIDDRRYYQVINAGVKGYNSYQLLVFFEEVLIRLRPDLITLHLGHNDATYRNMIMAGNFWFKINKLKQKGLVFSDITELNVAASLRYPNLFLIGIFKSLYKSRLFVGLTDFFSDIKFYSYYKKDSDGFYGKELRLSREVLERFVELGGKHKFRILFIPEITESDEFKRYHKMMEEVAKRNNIKIINLRRFFFGGSSELFVDYLHPSQKGHEAIADLLFDTMMPYQLNKAVITQIKD